MAKKGPATVDEYIKAAPPEARPHLRQMYRILKGVAPDGTEAIKWGVPVFWEGRVLFGFAAYKAHVSFGPGKAAMKRFSEELAGYKTGKGTMQIPYNQPVPEDLIPALKTAVDALTPGRQGAYILHFSAPKQSKTRESRVERYMQQILNGKGLNDRSSQ